ncbi:MAG: hypothetical protein H0W44_04080 [Gammaproteobacteria bacterium]|nr:hypothetical protein [Gammaproteobacteria bacterium]
MKKLRILLLVLLCVQSAYCFSSAGINFAEGITFLDITKKNANKFNVSVTFTEKIYSYAVATYYRYRVMCPLKTELGLTFNRAIFWIDYRGDDREQFGAEIKMDMVSDKNGLSGDITITKNIAKNLRVYCDYHSGQSAYSTRYVIYIGTFTNQ